VVDIARSLGSSGDKVPDTAELQWIESKMQWLHSAMCPNLTTHTEFSCKLLALTVYTFS
jgi:hypothetical protein